MAQVQRNLSVSAVIPPNASDYQFNFASDGQTTVHQRIYLSYTITYGVRAGLEVDSPITIVAHFNDDLAPDGSHVTEYITGSATNAYGGVPPVVDLINRTITWTIPHLPEGIVDQTLNFQLKTTENYSGTTPVDFTTKADMSNQFVTMPEKSVNQTYLFEPAHTILTPTPSPVLTATPGPQVTPYQLRIINVSINTISPQSATIGVSTNLAAKSYLRYGTTPQNLNAVTAPSAYGLYETIDLTNLHPATRYYFQVVSADEQGKLSFSEIYTFTTATEPLQTVPSKNAISLTSNDVVLASELLNDTENGNALALITTDTNYQLIYTYATKPLLRSSEVVLRSTSGEEQVVHMHPQTSLIYKASLRTNGPGRFTVLIRKTDANGNIHEQKIAQLKVMRPLTVIDKNSHTLIGDARVLLAVYNPAQGTFESVAAASFPGVKKNPDFTNALGELPLLLPAGRYQITVSALGYRPQTVNFTLGGENRQEFPTVFLQSDPFNLAAIGLFLRDWLNDLLQEIMQILPAISHSSRLFALVATGVTAGFVLLSYLLFTIRTQMKLHHLFPFFFFFIAVARKKHKEAYLSGIVQTPDKQALAGARIDIIDPKAKTVLTHVVTNAAGTFHIRNAFLPQTVLFLITKDGSAPLEVGVDTIAKESLRFVLQQHGEQKPLIIQEIHHLAGSLFEISLVFSLIFELFFFVTFGPIITLPFLAITLLNILLWLFYLEEHTRI